MVEALSARYNLAGARRKMAISARHQNQISRCEINFFISANAGPQPPPPTADVYKNRNRSRVRFFVNYFYRRFAPLLSN
jgi:hypothetical protein